jgi:hypothetical protein
LALLLLEFADLRFCTAAPVLVLAISQQFYVPACCDTVTIFLLFFPRTAGVAFNVDHRNRDVTLSPGVP